MDKISKKLADIQNLINKMNKNMSTKDDMKNLEVRLVDDMKNLEVRLKDDVKNLETRLIEKIDDAQMEIIQAVDKHKADKDIVRVLEKRVERLEDNAGLPPHLD